MRFLQQKDTKRDQRWLHPLHRSLPHSPAPRHGWAPAGQRGGRRGERARSVSQLSSQVPAPSAVPQTGGGAALCQRVTGTGTPPFPPGLSLGGNTTAGMPQSPALLHGVTGPQQPPEQAGTGPQRPPTPPLENDDGPGHPQPHLYTGGERGNTHDPHSPQLCPRGGFGTPETPSPVLGRCSGPQGPRSPVPVPTVGLRPPGPRSPVPVPVPGGEGRTPGTPRSPLPGPGARPAPSPAPRSRAGPSSAARSRSTDIPPRYAAMPRRAPPLRRRRAVHAGSGSSAAPDYNSHDATRPRPPAPSGGRAGPDGTGRDRDRSRGDTGAGRGTRTTRRAGGGGNGTRGCPEPGAPRAGGRRSPTAAPRQPRAPPPRRPARGPVPRPPSAGAGADRNVRFPPLCALRETRTRSSRRGADL